MSKKEKVLSADELALQKLNSNSTVSDEEYLNSLNSNISSQKLSNVDFNVGTIQSDLQAKEKFDAQIMSTLNGISGLNKEEKDYLLKTGKSGQLTIDEFKAAANAMSGSHERQQQMVDEKGKIINITPISQVDQSKGFIDQMNEGVQNLFGATGKALGQGHYYMKANDKGVLVPVPLAVGERPEAGYTVDSIWGNQDNANDDNRGSDITKKLLNLIPSTVQGILAIPEIAQTLVTGKTDSGFRTAQQELESYKFKTSDEFNKSFVDLSKVKEFSDVFDSKIYDLSPTTILNTSVNLGMSVAQLFLTRGALGFAKAGKIGQGALAAEEAAALASQAKTATFAANAIINTAEGLNAAKDAGIEGRAGAVTALAYGVIAGGLESKFGIESKILTKGANDAKKNMIKQIIKDNVEVVDGKLTKESIEKLYKETIKKGSSFFAKLGKDAIGESTTEVLQDMTKNASEEIHDYLMRNDPDEAKYNTKFWSPKALAGYVNSFGAGLVGGGAGSVFVKNQQSETAYNAIANGKENELKADLASSLKRGKITQDEYDRAVFKVDSYKEYYDATKDRPINDVDKRKIFDLTYEKQNIKSSIESLKEKNPNGINDVFIAQKEAELKDITNQANEIWAKASAAANPVKQTTPVWKTTIDKFAKTTNNQDKALSKDFTTREQIETAVGITPELNELAKPFKVEFKTPSLPEGSEGIKIENGFLSEPYMTEKTETSEPTLKTRELPVYAMEDKEGGTWLFAAGEKTDNDIPDTSYLIKVNADGKYEGHQEFHFEAPKKNTLTFDDIPSTFDRLGLSPVGTAKAVNEFKSEDEQLFAEVYDDVVAGNDKGKLTTFPGGTLGVIVNGKPIKFASSYHTNAFLNRENMPDGDVEVGIRSEENAGGKYGKGLMVYNIETGADVGYLRATDKSSGVKSSGVESDMTDVAKKKLEAIEADQKNYEIQETALGPKYINKNTGEAYDRVSSFVGGKFTGGSKLKGKAFEIGNIIQGIVGDFFQGEVKDYSEYNKNMSKADYDDVISQLNEVKNFAKRRGFAIVTKPLVIADDVNKIAGTPNLIMIDKNGGMYVYDVATIRNPEGNPIRQQMQKVWKGAVMTTEERVSAQVNIYADILEGKYDQDVKGVGVIPFNVNYNTKGENLKIDSVKKSKRIDYDRKQVLNNSRLVEVVEYKEPVKVSKYDKGERAFDVANEGELSFKTQEEATRFVAENSNNPAEIAEAYLTLEAVKENTKDYKFQALDEANITITEDNFNKVVDPNKMSPAIKKKFIRKTATPLDEQLQSISEDAGVEITEADFENYIDDFESPKKPSISLKRLLAERYYQITDGKKLTRAVARNIVEDVKKATAKKSAEAEANEIAKVMQSQPIIPEGKDIVRGEENDEMAFQKINESNVKQSLEKKLTDNYNESKEAYIEKNGLVLNTDEARGFSDEYNIIPELLSNATHFPSSDFVSKIYSEEVVKDAPVGKENVVLFTSGGGGAGKSRVLEGMNQNAHIVVDGTLSNFEYAKKDIDTALKNGKKVEIVFIYRNAFDSFVNGVITRAKRTGRTVPYELAIDANVNAVKTIIKLSEHYKDNNNVNISYYNNNFDKGNLKLFTLDDVKEIKIDANRVKSEVKTQIEKQYKNGELTRNQYYGLVGENIRGLLEARLQRKNAGSNEQVNVNARERTSEYNSERTTEEKTREINKVLSVLRKSFPNFSVKLDYNQEFAGALDRANKTIYINPVFAKLDTPIHEYGHILIDAIGYNNRVIQAGIKQLKDTDLWKETKERYSELNEEQLGKEVLAEAIGREGAGIFEEQSAKNKFKQILEWVYDWFKTKLGLNKNVAKHLAKQVIGGIGTKKMDVIGSDVSFQKTKKARKLDVDSYYRVAFGDKNSITIDDLKGAISTYEGMVANDTNDKTAARKLEASQKRLEEFEKAYKKYSYDYNKLNKIKEEQGVLDGKSFDELSELYNTISEFDPLADNAYLASVKYRIAYLMAEEQRAFLESKGNSIKPRAFADIKNKDVYMKALGHMTEAFPEMQYLSKAYDAAVQAMNEERREKQNKITELAKAVAKEEAKTLGLKMKDFVSGKAYEFFKWMDKGGELISTAEAYNLSKAKGDYVKYYREIREDYKDVQQETPAGFDENSLLMTDKNFAEQRSSNGVVAAIQSWLGTSSGMKQVVMNYTHSDKRSELLTLEEIEQALQKEADKGLISKAIASAKSVYYNTKAKKLLNKGTDEEGNDISHLKSQADYIVDRKGKLVNKFGVKRKEGYDYSKDFHAAMVQYLNDITWTKHMQPIIPLVESVEQFAKSTGASKGSAKNLEAWIGNWKKMHIYKDKPMTKFPEVEAFLKFLRKMTSLTSLAFNVKASIMNISIAEYNNWKELGGTAMVIGHKRLVASTKLGKKKISTKAHNILMKYGVVATDYDETSTLKAVGAFNQLAMGMTKFAEYIAQGSMFLGQMDSQMWKDFDQEGNYTGKDKDFKQKIEQYKTKVSNTHGKYSAKDRRNFELYELGKFVGQFKTWVPDWWKERFGNEYIDQYGNRQKGTYTDFMKYAISDLRKDIMKPEFWTSDKLEYVNARKNLKAAMVFGILLAIRAGNDDDERKRKKADFLSQAIGNLTFIFDPEQAKYVLKTPFAGMSYANNMLNLMTDLSPKNAKKVVPYAKVVDVGDMFGD